LVCDRVHYGKKELMRFGKVTLRIKKIGIK
jgi:hypothetical protein